jgi:hypothetical protein
MEAQEQTTTTTTTKKSTTTTSAGTATATATSTTTSTVGGTATVVIMTLDPAESAAFRSLVIMALASAVEFIAAARVCDAAVDCEDETAYAVVVGLVAVFLAVIAILLIRFMPGKGTNLMIQFTALFLMVWWCAGAGVLTFRAPFVIPGNGYFASWLAFAASVHLVYKIVPQVAQLMVWVATKAKSNDLDHRICLVITIGSAVALTASATLCDTRNSCDDQYGWAVAVSAFSCLVCFLFFVLSAFLHKFTQYFALVLLIAWIPGCGVLTFDLPFAAAGNGYFSAWVCFFGSAYWTAKTFTERK